MEVLQEITCLGLHRIEPDFKKSLRDSIISYGIYISLQESQGLQEINDVSSWYYMGFYKL